MISKFFKNVLIFIMVFSLVYTNLSFVLISNFLKTYQKTSNIIDNFYGLENNKNVVDNFLENNYASRLRIPEAYAAVGDARLHYGNNVNSIPKSRFYNSTTNTYDGPVNSVTGTANINWVVSKESPTEDVTILATQSSTGKLDIFCRSGDTWTKDISNVTVGTTGATRRFDVEFEKTSGIPMVLYSTNAATTNELAFYRKTGAGCGAGAWTGPANLNPTVVTSAVLWVELEARQTSGSNVLAAAFSDANATQGGKLQAMIWNGSSWGNESPAGAAQGWSDLSIELLGTAGANTAKVFDLAFETNSGDLFIAWGTSIGANGTNGWRYATCAGTLPCAWSGVNTPAGPADDATNVACAPDPGSDAIACIAQGNAGNDLSAWTWTGTAVGPTTGTSADATLLTAAAGDMHVDIDWVVNGSQRMAVGVYAETTTGVKYIYYDAVGNAWRYNSTTSFTVPGAPSTALQSVQVASNPSDRTQLLVTFTDANSDLWSKRLTYDGSEGGNTTALSSWSNADGGSALELTVRSITSQVFWMDWINVAPATPPSINIGVSAGSQITTLNSSDTSQFINSTSCSSDGTCAAFKLTTADGPATVTSIKISETGTVAANTTLANPTLLYDTDDNYSNGTSGTFGSQSVFASDQTVTFTNAGLVIPEGATYYFYIRFDLANGANYPVGGSTISFQISSLTDVVSNVIETGTVPAVLSGTTTVKPKITSYSNSTESALNYSAACTNCGARIGPGSAYRQTIVISGYGFGSDPGLGSRDTATNKVEIVGAATNMLSDDGSANTNVSAWSNTSITIRTDSNISGNTDANFGNNYGGANALQVTAGGQSTASNLNFYLFPQVTSLTVPTVTANAAREHDASDSDGVITLNGTRFGSSATGGWVRIFGCDSSTCSGPTGSVVTTSWNSTAITAQVPAVIADNLYTGSVVMQQGSGTANKSHTYTTTGFRILPRVTSLNPTSAAIGAAVTLNGNHLCQNGGTCPSSFDSNNKIVFTSGIDATVFTSWSNTAITTAVPSGATDGDVYAISNTYNSNAKTFGVLTPVPNNPTSLNQYIDSGLSQALSVGDTSSSTNLYLTMSISADFSGGTLYPQIEYKPIGTPFSCSGTGACAQAIEGTGKAGPGPVDCSLSSNNCAISISPSDNIYHWQARIRHNYSGSNYYSAWVSFGDNSESATDFKVDKVPPIISFSGGNTCNDAVSQLETNGATISWSLNESGTGQLEYSKNSNLSGSILSSVSPNNTFHSFSLNNLDSNTTYYFQVKSTDGAGNTAYRPASSPYCSFTTSNVTQPAKTTKFFVSSISSTISGGTSTSSDFSVFVPENSVSIKSAFLELSGYSGFNGTNNVSVSVNNQATSTYAIASNGNSFRVLYKIDPANINFDPVSNVMTLNPSANLNLSSAVLFLTYSFAP